MSQIAKEIEELINQLEKWRKSLRSLKQKYITSKPVKESIRSLALRGKNIILSLKNLSDIDSKTLEKYDEPFFQAHRI